MAILKVAKLGHPVLRMKAAPVSPEELKLEEIQNFIDDMIETMYEYDGVGIAAPQVHVSRQIAVCEASENARYPEAPEIPLTILINPQIVSRSKEMSDSWEGCLSIPGIRGLVPRYKSIRVKYKTRDGDVVENEFSDFVDRIFQHELDHLDGIIFLDRMDSSHEIITEKEYQRLMSKIMEEANLENQGSDTQSN